MSYVPNGAAANEAAKVKVLSVNHNLLSAARDKATEAQWQRMSWEDKLRTIESIDESELVKPIKKKKLMISDVLNPAHAGLATNQHTVFFHDTVAEIFNIGIALQQHAPNVFPDHHLPGQGHIEHGIKKSTFTKMSKLTFEGIREEQVEVIWDEAMNMTSVPGWADFKEANLQEIKEMLETLAIHHAMTPVELVTAARSAALVLQREMRLNSIISSPQSLQEQLIEAEKSQEEALEQLQEIELDNIRLQHEISNLSGDLNPQEVADHEHAADITQLKQYMSDHDPFTENEFTVLVDLTIASVRHSQSLAVWTKTRFGQQEDLTEEGVYAMLKSLAEVERLTTEDLSHRLSKINVFGNTPQRDDIFPYEFDPMTTPERMSMQKKINRLETSTSQFNIRYEKALAENNRMQKRLDSIVEGLKKKEETHIAYIKSLEEPEYPPPEVPETLYVSLSGGWADVRRNGEVLPGKYGPQKVEGRYTLQEGSWNPESEEVEECSAIWTCDTNNEKSKIISRNGIWVVTYIGDEDEDVITSKNPHNGWRPHELDGVHPFQVVGDTSDTWHVTISAEEFSKPHHGLCKRCLPKHNIYKLALYHEEDGVRQANAEVDDLRARHHGTLRDASLLERQLRIYQDNTEAPPIRRGDGMEWGTNGEFHDIVAPKWTGGRPSEADHSLYKLPVPRIRLRDPMSTSRSSAVSTLIQHYSAPRNQSTLYPTSTQAPSHVRRPVPTPHMHTQMTFNK